MRWSIFLLLLASLILTIAPLLSINDASLELYKAEPVKSTTEFDAPLTEMHRFLVLAQPNDTLFISVNVMKCNLKQIKFYNYCVNFVFGIGCFFFCNGGKEG